MLGTPITEGEGISYADLDLSLITKRKRMMDSVGHYSRPELLSLLIDRSATSLLAERDSDEPAPAWPRPAKVAAPLTNEAGPLPVRPV